MEHIFFANLLNLNELCLLELEVAIEKASHTNLQAIQSEHSLKVIRCRELIFTEPDIIATPNLDDNRIEIIMQQSLFKTGKIQGRLQRMGVQFHKPRRVTPADFQTCLNYTMVAKLAPVWNKLGKYLVQGRDFVCEDGKQNAIEYDLHIGSDEIYISLKATVVRSPPIKLDQIGVVGPIQKEFYANYLEGRVEEYSIYNKWCHVLPSLKKGQVINVLHQLPPDGAFRTYREIKKHWKNNYGYRLPESYDGLLYYQIYFKPIGDVLFTYPSVCVRSENPQTYPRVDPAPILSDFLDDLTSRVHSVCGRNLQFAKEPHFPEAELLECTKTPAGNMNLTKDMPSPTYAHYRNHTEPKSETQLYKVSTQAEAVINASQTSTKKVRGRSENGQIGPFTDSQNSHLNIEKFFPRFGRVQSSKMLTQNSQKPSQTVNYNQADATVTQGPIVPRFAPFNKFETSVNQRNSFHRNYECKLASQPEHRPIAHHSSQICENHDAGTPKAKKPRTKPQVQQDMDPEDLARNNQLSKANSATLIAWLKSKGIPCKTTDKKMELMNKVLLAVNLRRSASFD